MDKNFLIAKTSHRGTKRRYVKILDGCEIFTHASGISAAIDYQNTYKLEDDEWFKLTDFSKKSYCIDLLKHPFNSTSYETINSTDYSKLQYICSFQDEQYYYFQKCNKHSVIKNKIIKLNAPTLIQGDNMLIIRDNFDALYDNKKDELYFKSLTCISSIFKGIDQLYREATQQETVDFLNYSMINLQNGYNADRVKKANRKRIAIAYDTLQAFSKSDTKTICKYIRQYCPSLNFDKKNDKFDISNEDELKYLLYGIEQRFYTTGIGNEKRIANSILKI